MMRRYDLTLMHVEWHYNGHEFSGFPGPEPICFWRAGNEKPPESTRTPQPVRRVSIYVLPLP